MDSQPDKHRRRRLSQFWACKFASDAALSDFVRENNEVYYSEENDHGDGPIPLFHFAGSQGKSWYDHDCIEMGSVGDSNVPVEAICASFSAFWAEEFMRRAAAVPITPTHFIMAMDDEPVGGRRYRHFPNAVSVAGPDFLIAYLGEIEHYLYEEPYL